MKIKQIKQLILAITITAATMVSAFVFSDTTFAAPACPDGQEYHASDNACWTKEIRSEVQGRCPSTYNREGERCVKYTRENSVPTENGKPLSLSCPNGTVHHTSDNKCWKEEDIGAAKNCATTGRPATTCKPCPQAGTLERNGRCIQYTETEENPVINQQGPPSEQDKKAARDRIYADCKAAGGTDEECNKQADDASKKCENDANYSECMQKQNNIENGECEDGSTPNASTGKCANGEEPKTAGTDDTGKKCGEAETVLIQCEEEGVEAIGSVLRIFVTVLTVIIGIAAVGGLAWASLLYAKAQDNEGNTKESKELIRNIVIGLFLYGFLIAIINWLVPGGVIG